HDLRQEPDEAIPQVRICAGGAEQSASLPRPTIREPSRPATSERDVFLRRPVRIRAWHPCRMAKNLEMDRIFALSSTRSLRWHGPLVQTAPQTSSISAGWTIPVYLQRFDGAACLVKFRFGPRHVSQHSLHPLRTQHDKFEREKERQFGAKTHETPPGQLLS